MVFHNASRELALRAMMTTAAYEIVLMDLHMPSSMKSEYVCVKSLSTWNNSKGIITSPPSRSTKNISNHQNIKTPVPGKGSLNPNPRQHKSRTEKSCGVRSSAARLNVLDLRFLTQAVRHYLLQPTGCVQAFWSGLSLVGFSGGLLLVIMARTYSSSPVS